MSGRKTISVLVTCIFVLSSFSAAYAVGEIGWRDTRLDAVFSSGQVRMREVPLAGIRLTAEDLVLPAEYQAALSENAAEVADWLASLYALSVSPSGNAALLTDGQMLIAWNNGKARIVQPNMSRGVEDTYGNFQKIWSQPISALFRASGNDIAWSPDGRYASVTNSRSVLTMMRLENDPHLGGIAVKGGDGHARGAGQGASVPGQRHVHAAGILRFIGILGAGDAAEGILLAGGVGDHPVEPGHVAGAEPDHGGGGQIHGQDEALGFA